MPTAVVTGANGGVGLAFAKKLIEEGYTVYACDIKVGDEMQKLKTKYVHQLDVTSPSSMSSFAGEFRSQPLDLLLNVAGIMPTKSADSLATVSLDSLTKTFSVNTFGPLLLTQALIPALLKSSSSKVANVSSRVGSIADNLTGGAYAYRASKAALNAISKSMSVD
ncbi:C-factor [Hyphodiscus hymeniophilus]|uniref:C-factor n=1 Tax=Hyphodiscus hymeniophilus TaxID=353542 RepID=A0A9P6VJQ4_9HELO|nr:C-factor [Hyphodiscus hymeniophilus]